MLTIGEINIIYGKEDFKSIPADKKALMTIAIYSIEILYDKMICFKM